MDKQEDVNKIFWDAKDENPEGRLGINSKIFTYIIKKRLAKTEPRDEIGILKQFLKKKLTLIRRMFLPQ